MSDLVTDVPGPDDPLPGIAPLGDRPTRHSQRAALYVSCATMLIIAGIVGVLWSYLHMSNLSAVQPLNSGQMMEACPSKPCSDGVILAMMEQDAQILRSERMRNALNSRMAIFVIAEIVALILVALGGVLIFDRIRGAGVNHLSVKDFTLKSNWPGVVLCGFGTLILFGALVLTTTSGYRLSIWDRPVFVSDPNWARNRSLLLSGQGADPVKAAEEEREKQEKATMIEDLTPTETEDAG